MKDGTKRPDRPGVVRGEGPYPVQAPPMRTWVRPTPTVGAANRGLGCCVWARGIGSALRGVRRAISYFCAGLDANVDVVRSGIGGHVPAAARASETNESDCHPENRNGFCVHIPRAAPGAEPLVGFLVSIRGR